MVVEHPALAKVLKIAFDAVWDAGAHDRRAPSAASRRPLGAEPALALRQPFPQQVRADSAAASAADFLPDLTPLSVVLNLHHCQWCLNPYLHPREDTDGNTDSDRDRPRRSRRAAARAGRARSRARRRGHQREALLLGSGQTALAGTLADSAANDLIYHGGNAGAGAIGVETKPAVYLVYWGQEWADGFQTSDTDGKLYSSKTLQNYLNSFFGSVGGSTWAGVQTQYCNVDAGRLDQLPRRGRVRHEPEASAEGRLDRSDSGAGRHRRRRSRREPRRRPDRRRGAAGRGHFGYNPQATYIVLTPPRPIATGQPVYCGYHSQTT